MPKEVPLSVKFWNYINTSTSIIEDWNVFPDISYVYHHQLVPVLSVLWFHYQYLKKYKDALNWIYGVNTSMLLNVEVRQKTKTIFILKCLNIEILLIFGWKYFLWI